ncbi:MAG TPA: RNA ligase family protein [Herpetosiphonaceae bacterium]
MLLTRTQFRDAVFERDHHRCVICGAPAQDAHHIVERRLWPDGGYYLQNGASLCADHHIAAEQTTLSCDDIRQAAGIRQILLPPQFYDADRIDKWGNYEVANGTRLRGELFDDESVQRILRAGGVHHLFSDRVKYPRTPHLPWSPGRAEDDLALADVRAFVGCEVVVTAKMDGANTTLYRDGIHGRSVASAAHPSQSWVKQLHAQIAYDIPPGYRVCGENLYARHSIAYSHLGSYFQVFSMWSDRNHCLSWAETEEWTALLELSLVPVLYRGIWDEQLIQGMYQPVLDGDPCEGYVVRLADAFPYSAFRQSVAKYVRAGHVQTVHNWVRQPVVPNGLQTNEDRRGSSRQIS